ncbi:MAG: MFS transporter [Firmicutes bacterium]|nr:MFS transporter [Bacillota bacterium]MBR7113060.1 MFS transporter [Bacillota bacterium]
MPLWKRNLYIIYTTQLTAMCAFGFVFPFISFYLQEMGIPAGSDQLNFYVALSTLLPSLAMAIFAPIWGRMADRYGRKKMMLRAQFCASAALVLMGLAPNAETFLVLRFIQGIFTGTLAAANAFIAANTPSDKISYSIGLMTSANFLGFSFGPVIGGFAAEIVGYRGCFFIGSVLVFISAVAVLFAVKEDPSTYGKELLEQRKAEKTADGGSKANVLSAFVITMLAALILNRVCRSIFNQYTGLYVQQMRGGIIEGTSRISGIISGVGCLAVSLSSIFVSRLGDKYDKMELVFKLILLCLPVSLLFGWMSGISIFCFGLGFGIFNLAIGAIEPLMTSAASEKVDPAVRGTLFGFIATANSIAMMIIPMLSAAIATIWDYRGIIWSISVFICIQILFFNYLRKHNGTKHDTADCVETAKATAEAATGHIPSHK